MPYLAANVSEFWRRWHISLSTWLRDYLFIPLGGSRGGNWQTARNLLFTMTLGGLWHGASWNFVLWGLVHGLLLLAHRSFSQFASRFPALQKGLDSYVGTVLGVALTFLTVCFTWVLFRATTLEQAATIYQRMLIPSNGLGTPAAPVNLLYTAVIVALCHWFGSQQWYARLKKRMPELGVSLGYCTVLLTALVLSPRSGQAFIYFQF
jgi:alginate O-acetyltransferase complex protein AlgI